MSQKTVSGYLIVGDISGYTSYVATTELEHAQEVLAELLELIVDRFQPLLTIQRLEGDAVFAHAPDGQISRGESLIEVLESTYTAFRDHIRGIVQRTTCECKACKAIPGLDLKFFVHYGDYVVQHVSGISELVGTEVNRLFRLTKNQVTEETGWNAYIMLTAVALEKTGVGSEGMHEQVESHEHLGEVTTHVIDLHARYQAITDARHVVLTEEDAHASLTFDFASPPAVVWEWLNDPYRRSQMNPETRWSAMARPGGRTGAGASNHCAHGKGGLTCETILDWRPFEYVTTQSTSNGMPYKFFDMTRTDTLEPISNGTKTRLRVHVRLERLPALISRRFAPMFLKKYRDDYFVPLDRTMIEERGRQEQQLAAVIDPVAVPTQGD